MIPVGMGKDEVKLSAFFFEELIAETAVARPGIVAALQTSSGLASLLATLALSDLPMDYFNGYLDRINLDDLRDSGHLNVLMTNPYTGGEVVSLVNEDWPDGDVIGNILLTNAGSDGQITTSLGLMESNLVSNGHTVDIVDISTAEEVITSYR